MAIFGSLLAFLIGASIYPATQGFHGPYIEKNGGHFGVGYVVPPFENGPVLSGNSLTIKPQEIYPNSYLRMKPGISPFKFSPAPIQGQHVYKQIPSSWKHPYLLLPAGKYINHRRNVLFSKSVPHAPKASRILFPITPLPSKVSSVIPKEPQPPKTKARTIKPTVHEEPPVDGGTVVIDKPLDTAPIPSNNFQPNSPVNINQQLGADSSNIVPFVGVVRDMGLDGQGIQTSPLPPSKPPAPLLSPPPPAPIPAPPVVRGNQASFEGRFSAGLQPDASGIPTNLIDEGHAGIVNGGRTGTGLVNGPGLNNVQSAVPFGPVSAFGPTIDNSLAMDNPFGSNSFTVPVGLNMLEPQVDVNNLDSPLGPNNFETQFVANNFERQFGPVGFVQQNGPNGLPAQSEVNNVESQFGPVTELPSQPLSGLVPFSPERFGEPNIYIPSFSDNFFPFQPTVGSPTTPFNINIRPITSLPQENVFSDSTENGLLDFGQINIGDGFTFGGLGPNIGTPDMFGPQITGPQVFDGSSAIGIEGDILNINSVVGGL